MKCLFCPPSSLYPFFPSPHAPMHICIMKPRLFLNHFVNFLSLLIFHVDPSFLYIIFSLQPHLLHSKNTQHVQRTTSGHGVNSSGKPACGAAARPGRYGVASFGACTQPMAAMAAAAAPEPPPAMAATTMLEPTPAPAAVTATVLKPTLARAACDGSGRARARVLDCGGCSGIRARAPAYCIDGTHAVLAPRPASCLAAKLVA